MRTRPFPRVFACGRASHKLRTTMDPEAELLRRESQRRVEMALAKLPRQERTVISHRFGLHGERPLVLKDVGAILGVSRERVRQIESRAIQRLRRILSRASVPARARPRKPHAAPRERKPARSIN